MSYLSVLPLNTVKLYLKIDDTQNETDAEITSMINSALRHIEQKTRQFVYSRDVDYIIINRCARVYDYPINSVESPDDYDSKEYSTYTNYSVGGSIDKITLNVGYNDPDDVPDELKDAALAIIDVMFYGQNEKKSFKDMLPFWVREYLDANRRFIF